LRRIPLGIHAAIVRQFDVRQVIEHGYALPPPGRTRRSGRGRPELPKTFYVALARRYRQLVRQGKRPNVIIAKKLGWKPSRVRSAIARCRKRGLLI
jgi:hypothetical protein